ncbi:MAG: hypothetical protein A3C82_00655 [Candidatus Wildermuthbacteria bacterium RIFCSPHIGHO2_02_FULL_47_12]|uniref:Uncharacterized protein n=1 Tax=Candidatus Wildermuthbacteria bacterium RIFCSPHIGHO2_02_FULL_47_12 TaxID=1802451 RepID=A0A1G2R2U5_9BACT|nr:MAG: hypothetical protein A3C82_00655 [Candidatus Wildermuthbacteria bacterium RIFCSPHIGHO2_02_FULL_47_12]
MKLTLEVAKKIAKAAHAKAKEMSIPAVIAIVDEGANLLLLERTEGSMIAGIALSQDKAYTAAATGFDTHQIAPLAQPGQLGFGLAGSDRGRLIVFAGGLVLRSENAVVGGIGVSGGLAPQDQEIAQAGADALASL